MQTCPSCIQRIYTQMARMTLVQAEGKAPRTPDTEQEWPMHGSKVQVLETRPLRAVKCHEQAQREDLDARTHHTQDLVRHQNPPRRPTLWSFPFPLPLPLRHSLIVQRQPEKLLPEFLTFLRHLQSKDKCKRPQEPSQSTTRVWLRIAPCNKTRRNNTAPSANIRRWKSPLEAASASHEGSRTA